MHYSAGMPRLARVVVPGVAHHVTQRGNRRQQTFFSDADYRVYRTMVAEACRAANVEVWAYCLMPNHVHLVMVPSDEDGLRRALANAHRRYSRNINEREGWRGYLWQGRFSSAPMDARHTLAAARYAELNPVRAGLAAAGDWAWSSARAHLEGRDDDLVTVRPLLDQQPDWGAFLAAKLSENELETLRAGERLGRPLGSPAFVKDLETRTGRPLAPGKRGPRLKSPPATAQLWGHYF